MSEQDGWNTWDDWPLEPQSQTEPDHGDWNSSLDIKPSDEQRQQQLVERLQNVILEDTQNHRNDYDYEQFEDVSNGSKHEYPLRPYAEDCAFYMKTGTCKFKLACKFNHPVNRGFQVEKQKKDREVSMEQTANIECKYYLTAGGCKFGEACKFRHSMDHSMDQIHQNKTELPELNFLGLPIRLGEKECPFYMRNGSCGYGANCRFHHPDPTDIGATDPEKPAQDESFGKISNSWGNHNDKIDPFSGSVASKLEAALWLPHVMMNEATSTLGDYSSAFSEVVVPRGEHLNTEHNGYQQIQGEEFPSRPGQPECAYFMRTGDCKYRSACRYHHPKTRSAVLHINALGDKGLSGKPLCTEADSWKSYPSSDGGNFENKINALTFQQQTGMEQYPERPGQPKCSHFMKTGDCKFKSACRYDHPKGRVPVLPAISLSELGLPLRPGSEVCKHYKQYGLCKFGRSCVYDHPENLRSPKSLAGSRANFSSGNKSTTPVEGSKESDCQNGSRVMTL